MPRPALLLGFASLLAPAYSEECGVDIGARWKADPDTGRLVHELTTDCSILSPKELSDDLSNRHVHVSGDPTFRHLVQYFELEWEACAARPPQKELLTSSRADADAEDHALCHLAYGRNVYSWLKRPLNGACLV